MPENYSNFKRYFPALLNNSALSYLDSASSSQVHESAIEAINNYLSNGHGNPHRGMYAWSESAESIVSKCREQVASLLSTTDRNIAFTSGTTESINLIANSFIDQISEEQSILVTEMEHHANLLPWQRLAKNTGATLKYLPIKEDGTLDFTNLETVLANNCAVFAFTHQSNVLGTVNPIKAMLDLANKMGVVTVIDGAQAVAHHSINLQDLDCDYYAFSAHKLYGPSGVGVLYAKSPNEVEPLKMGGGIVNRVTMSENVLRDGILKLEAGSPNMVGLAGFSATLYSIKDWRLEEITANEKRLVSKLLKAIAQYSDIKVISNNESPNIVSFTSTRYHSHDIATVLAENGVCVRAGHHCAQPCLNALAVKHCVRVSVAAYNDDADIEKFLQALSQVEKLLN